MTKHGIHFIDPPRPDNRVVAAEFSGKATAEDINALAARLKAKTGDKAGAMESAKLALERVEAEGDQPGVAGDSETLKGELESWQGE